ncbi:MAG: tetratricopeptide repeat protein [Actinobacteria bacterium]|nr:tetratricopeptide repeat protein [Actinomycetota bacterium]
MPGGAVDLSHLAAGAGSGSGSQLRGGPGSQPPDQGGGGQVIDMPSLVIDLSDQTFEQAVQLSGVVPVVVELRAEAHEPSEALSPILEKVTKEFGGRVLLARVDAQANPGLVNAFQVQAIPTVVALVGERPVPLFQGPAPEQQVRELFAQLLELSAQQGVAGRVSAPDAADGTDGEDAVAPVNPAHVEALDAIERGDYAAAVTAYEQVLAKAPADHEARAALVQVRLLHRLEGAGLDEIRQAAAEAPDDIDAQLRVADLDVSGGHVEDAFLRLLELFAARGSDADAADERTRIRERLLELFEVVGAGDPRVAAARTRLANLLY